MSWFKNLVEKQRLKKYMKKTPEQEYDIYKRRLMRGESETSARAGLKHVKMRAHTTSLLTGGMLG